MFQKHMDNLEKRILGVEKLMATKIMMAGEALENLEDRIRELEKKLALPEDCCCRNGHDYVPFSTSTDTLLHLQNVLYCRRCGVQKR